MDAKSFAAGFFACLLLSFLALGIGIFLEKNSPGAGMIPQLADSACPQISPLFSPGSGDDIVGLIRSARETIDLEMYVFTDESLARELVAAQARGVRVRVILESRVESDASVKKIPAALLAGGVEARWASLKYALTHSKMMIIDGKKVLVGSINFSKSAQGKNREAAVLIESEEKTAQYAEIFEKDWLDSMEIPS